MEILNQFLPFQPHGSHEVILAVQYSIFECGGVAIGVCVSHRIADGTSATTFLGAWSATSCREEDIVCPKFHAAMYFPPKDISWLGKGRHWGHQGEDRNKKIGVTFDKSSIAALKEKASSTCVAAVSAFIWKCLMVYAISKSKPAPAVARAHARNNSCGELTPEDAWSHPCQRIPLGIFATSLRLAMYCHRTISLIMMVMITIVIGRWQSN